MAFYNDILDRLENFLIFPETDNTNNQKLKDCVINDDYTNYQILINEGYNPYRKDIHGKRPFEYSDKRQYEKYAVEWINILAYRKIFDYNEPLDHIV